MAPRRVSTVTQPVTRSLAYQFMNMTPVPNERRVNPTRRRKLKADFLSGRVLPFYWNTAEIAGHDGILYRVNGRTSSTVLAEDMEAIPPGAVAVISHFVCDDLADLASVWKCHDSPVSVRNDTERLAIHVGACPELEEAAGGNRRHLSQIRAGLDFAITIHSKGRHKTDPERKLDRLNTNVPFITWVRALGHCYDETFGKPAPLFDRESVIAAMFKTWQKSPDAATEFWTMVRDECGPTGNPLHRDHPAVVLRGYLATRLISKRQGTYGGKPADRKTMFIACLEAWNAYRDGVPGKRAHRYGENIPAVK